MKNLEDPTIRAALTAVIAYALTAATLGLLGAVSCGPRMFSFVALIILIYGSPVFAAVGVAVALFLSYYRDTRTQPTIRPWLTALAASLLVFGACSAIAYVIPARMCAL